MKICFASNNKHKLEEISGALEGAGIDLLTLDEVGCSEELPETQPTLEGNAIQKAMFVWSHFRVPCFADDTGLEVASLHGAPGVYSARYAGPQRNSNDNINLLLNELVSMENRRARFRTVIALVGFDIDPVLFEGEVHGRIAEVPSGAAGFGYDPVFVPDGYTRTFAEMSMQEKNRLSHRAAAVHKLAAFLRTHAPAS